MISLDQVMLLEQKVESAVAKIQQLQAENDALRSKCSELTNALSSKSEQLSSFETDQSQIEDGIKKALDRLNQIENSVLKAAAGQAASTTVNLQTTAQIQKAVPQNNPVQNTIPQNKTAETPGFHSAPAADSFQNPLSQASSAAQQVNPVTSANQLQQQASQPVQNNFYTMNEAPAPQDFSEEEAEEENPDNLGFDIF